MILGQQTRLAKLQYMYNTVFSKIQTFCPLSILLKASVPVFIRWRLIMDTIRQSWPLDLRESWFGLTSSPVSCCRIICIVSAFINKVPQGVGLNDISKNVENFVFSSPASLGDLSIFKKKFCAKFSCCGSDGKPTQRVTHVLYTVSANATM